MQPFDEGHFARREKQIRDLYNMRAATWACFGLAVFLTLVSIPLFARAAPLGTFAAFFAILFWMGGFFMLIFTSAQKAADKAIQQEYERLMELYSRAGVKPKRDDQTIRLTDDGEIETDLLSQESPLAGRERRS